MDFIKLILLFLGVQVPAPVRERSLSFPSPWCFTKEMDVFIIIPLELVPHVASIPQRRAERIKKNERERVPPHTAVPVLRPRHVDADIQRDAFGSTYSLVQVDGVLAGDHVGDGRTGLLAGGLDVAGHFCEWLDSPLRSQQRPRILTGG